MGDIYIDGVNLNTYGVVASSGGAYNSPVRDVSEIEILGRNGSLIRDNGRFKNVIIDYPCYISRNFESNFSNMKNYLLSKRGYFKLQDSYDTTHFRKAFYASEIRPNTTPLNIGAEFTLSFNAMPQRFRNDGSAYVGIDEPYEDPSYPMHPTVAKVLYADLPQFVKDAINDAATDTAKPYAKYTFATSCTAKDVTIANRQSEEWFVCACTSTAVVMSSNSGTVRSNVSFAFTTVYADYSPSVDLMIDSKLSDAMGLNAATFYNVTSNECAPLYRISLTTNADLQGVCFSVNGGYVYFNHVNTKIEMHGDDAIENIYVDSDSYAVYAISKFGRQAILSNEYIEIVGNIRLNVGKNTLKYWDLYPLGNTIEAQTRWYDL